MGNIQERPSELIQYRRKQLVKGLKNDSWTLLDGLMSRGIFTVSEYDALYALDDPERRVQDLLHIVEKKGEFACQTLLKYASEIHPYDPNDPVWKEWITPQEHGFHRQRGHGSSFVDKRIKITCGGMCIWVPNPAEEDEPNCGEQSLGAGCLMEPTEMIIVPS
ncbi:nucleolar protein 3-like [Macrotis lagotis]|uniref:nucleolar protein 3-like n=1 Tax=Macrotis lagotis TaxID=92651 RepID=UPI003D69BD1A